MTQTKTENKIQERREDEAASVEDLASQNDTTPEYVNTKNRKDDDIFHVTIFPIVGIVGHYCGKYANCANSKRKNDCGQLHNYDFWYKPAHAVDNGDMSYLIGPFTYEYIRYWANCGYFQDTKLYCSVGNGIIQPDYVTSDDILDYDYLDWQNEYEYEYDSVG